jgi:gluconolactonase
VSSFPPHWKNLEPEAVATGFRFPEGPSVYPDGSICLVNCHDSVINRVRPDGSVEDFAQLPGKGNGTKLANDGTLYVCDYHANCIVAVDRNGTVSTVTTHDIEGNPFRGPNDLCLSSTGGFYFTAPQGSGRNNPIGKVYYHSLDSDETIVIVEGLAFPNGLTLDRDESNLYVAESQHARIWRYCVLTPGQLLAGRVFVDLPGGHEPDGIEFDEEGNLYVAHYGSGHVFVIDPQGRIVFQLPAGGRNPTNLAFGGPRGDWLYVTEAETNRLMVLKIGKKGLRRPRLTHA